MIAWLRTLWNHHIIRDATPEEDACESCETVLAIHCTAEQAATCKTRLVAIGPGGGIRVRNAKGAEP